MNALRKRYQFKDIHIVSTRGISSMYANDKGIIILLKIFRVYPRCMDKPFFSTLRLCGSSSLSQFSNEDRSVYAGLSSSGLCLQGNSSSRAMVSQSKDVTACQSKDGLPCVLLCPGS